ncbi:nuclear mitotic apparatus protein 1 isoform X1 [Hyperolius riggenbachi]|uniref:nuclear mitotic apparatus protein 1 isoform X1 n=1 Tax=Hyperolius riggenbachi TaxID=752182 RepID=UPI0035A3AC94
MALQGTKIECLLKWVNSLKVNDPIEDLYRLQDLNILIKIIHKLNGSTEEQPQILNKSLEDRLAFLQRHLRCGSKAENLVQWQKILQGEHSELEICKVLVLLFYVSNMKCKNPQEWESYDHKTQTELASILRFVLDNEEDFALDDKLLRFLQKKGRPVPSSESASSSDESVSPNVSTRTTQVRFLELHKVASSSSLKSFPLDSPSSPMSEVLHLPQFQMRKLRKQIQEGRELRDELDLELSETRKRLAEKEAQIFLMQQRIERLKVLNEKQTDQQEPRELEELREKNESLMIRLRDALKQCQDMKTDRNQLERKNDQLSDENGDLTYKVRGLSSHLAQLQEALNESIEVHETSVSSWQQRQNQMENELTAAITEKKSLEERNQILQEKISMLEEQLKAMENSEQQEKGERMGDVLQLEQLQQEVTSLNTKIMELRTQITQMEEEKKATVEDLNAQRLRFDSEKNQLQDIVNNLQTSLSEMTFQREKQDQEAKVQEEKLTSQITTLKLEITKLKASLVQKDETITALQKEVEEEKSKKGHLEEALQKQEESSKRNVEELQNQVNHLRNTLTTKEEKSVELTEKLNVASQQMISLERERNNLVEEKDSANKTFNDYKSEKEEELRKLDQTCQSLQKDHRDGLGTVDDLKREKAELTLKVQELDDTILDLVAKCQHLDSENDTQRKSHASALESLKVQLAEQEAQIKSYEQTTSEMEQIREENRKIKEKLLALEDAVENLKGLLEKERARSASLENQERRNTVLEGDLKKLSENQDQTLAELTEEKATSEKLKAQLQKVEEEYKANGELLQQKLADTSAVIKQREEEIEKVRMEIDKWKDIAQNSSQVEERIELLKKDYDEVCQQLEKEKLKISEMEAEAKTAMSTHLEKASHLESELSAARALVEKKEAYEQVLLQSIRSLEEKLRLAQEQEVEKISQLEKSRSSTEQDLNLLSKELAEEKHKRAELESTLKRLEEHKSERITSLQSEISCMQATIKEREHQGETLSKQLEQLGKQLTESNEKHKQELMEKDNVVSKLSEEKERAIADLKSEQTNKFEVEAQLQKSGDLHKSEFSSLQNELSRSLDLITMKETELEKLSKEVAAKGEELLKERQIASAFREELSGLKEVEEQASKQKEEIKNYKESIKTMDSELVALKAAVAEKETENQRLERLLQEKIEENASIREGHHSLANVVSSLESRITDLEEKVQDRELRMNRALKDAAEARRTASEKATSSEQWQKALQELEGKIQQEQEKSSELTKQLEESRSMQTERESSLEALKIELIHKVQELEQSQKSFNESSKELSHVLSVSQEQEKSLAEAKEQSSKFQEEIEKRSGQVDVMQEELNNLTAKMTTTEKSFLEVKELLARESNKSTDLEKQLKLVQEKLEASAKELTEKQSTIESLKTEYSSYKQGADKQSASVSGLQKKLGLKDETIAKLEQEVKTWSEKCSQKEVENSSLNQQLQNVLNELTCLRNSNEEMKSEQTQAQSKLTEDLLKSQKISGDMKAELEKTKAQVASLLVLKETLSTKEATLETLQKESNHHIEQIAKLQEDNKQLLAENKSLTKASEQIAKLQEDNKQLLVENKSLTKASEQIAKLLEDNKQLLAENKSLTKASEQIAKLQEDNKQLLAENKSLTKASEQFAKLQEDNKQLLAENKSLTKASEQSAKKMEMDLAKVSEKHTREIESLQQNYEKTVSEGKGQADELGQKFADLTSKYEHAKSKLVEEKHKFQEEKQKLLAQVEQLETVKKDHAEQVQELNKQLSQQEKTIRSQQQKLKQRDSEAHEEVEKKQKRLAELEKELEKQTQAVEHYKAQMDKAKVHYDAKKQQAQELSDQLHSVTREQEQLRRDNEELRKESERLNKDLQLSLLQTKEAEQTCKTLTSQVRSLEAQVEYADRQLREHGKSQVATDALKSREALYPPRATQSHPDVSADSLDLSSDEDNPMNSTRVSTYRKNERARREPPTAQDDSLASSSSNRLPKKVESLESLYFTPIPTRSQAKMDSSLGSIPDFSLDSTQKTRSARRRTTQVINITMTKRTKEEVDQEAESANASFYSLRSAISHQNVNQQGSGGRRGRKPKSAVSAPAIHSLPSQESLVKAEPSSSDDSINNDILMNLPGYRPSTRSSARLSQASNRSSFYVATCHDEPDPQEDWNRIAELQQRNKICPPHLKTSYPLESRPSILTTTVTDEEMKTGDPKETLRRATLLPSQIRESVSGTRRMSLSSSGAEHAGGGIHTRQQMKRVWEEPHDGPDTPESKKPTSCFSRPMTPKDKPESRRTSTAADSKASGSQKSSSTRRQSTAFSVLITPKKLGSSLLRRGLNKKSTPKSTPQGRGASGKSPHLSIRKSPGKKSPGRPPAAAKSPKTTSRFFERKQTRNK